MPLAGGHHRHLPAAEGADGPAPPLALDHVEITLSVHEGILELLHGVDEGEELQDDHQGKEEGEKGPGQDEGRGDQDEAQQHRAAFEKELAPRPFPPDELLHEHIMIGLDRHHIFLCFRIAALKPL